MILFSRQEDGSYKQTGEFSENATLGRFSWQREDGSWDGGWIAEPIADLLSRLTHSGPYKYQQYRILEAEKPELVIKPTCAGCGVIAGIDCQRTCEYIFGRADVTESLPISFNADHQFSVSIAVVTDGKNFGNKKPKSFYFNSVRCAELFLMEHGHTSKTSSSFGDSQTIGNGERLLAYLGGTEVVKARKKRAPNKAYLARLAGLTGGELCNLGCRREMVEKQRTEARAAKHARMRGLVRNLCRIAPEPITLDAFGD